MPLCSLPIRRPSFPADAETRMPRSRWPRSLRGPRTTARHREGARDGYDVEAVRDGRVHANQQSSTLGRVPPLVPDDLLVLLENRPFVDVPNEL
jgi:hypothetical protein